MNAGSVSSGYLNRAELIVRVEIAVDAGERLLLLSVREVDAEDLFTTFQRVFADAARLLRRLLRKGGDRQAANDGGRHRLEKPTPLCP